MELKYKIARSTDLDSEIIIKKILLKINQDKYGLIDFTYKDISFNIGSGNNWERFSKLSSGKFEIVANRKSNVVVLEYCPIPLFDFVWVGIICLAVEAFSIITKVYPANIIILVVLGQLFLKRYILKGIANDMLDYVSRSK